MKTLQKSFAAGEITPELSGKIDSPEYQTGLAVCRNFITLPHGPVVYRPGFLHEQYGFGVDHAARLIPFVPDEDSSFLIAIVAGKGYIIAGGGLGTVTGSSASNAAILSATGSRPCQLRVATAGSNPQPNGWIYIRPNVGADANNLDAAAGQWWKTTFIDEVSGYRYYRLTHPVRGDLSISFQIPGGDPMTVDWAGGFDNALAIDLPYAAADLPFIHYAQSYDVLTLVCHGYAPRTVRLDSGVWSVTREQVGSGFISGSSGFTAPFATVDTAGTAAAAHVFFAWMQTRVNDEWVYDRRVGDPVTLTVDPADGVLTVGLNGAETLAANQRVIVYRLVDGTFYAFATVTGPQANSFNVSLAEVDRFNPAPSSVVVGQSISESSLLAIDPRAVAYYQQRKLYGGTSPASTSTAGPQWLLATRPGAEQDTSRHVPAQADDAFALTVAALRRNTIQHLVPLSSLVILTGGGVFTLAGGPDGLATDSFQIDVKSYHGANFASPAVSGDAVFYAAARGGHIYAVRYSLERGGFIVTDVCLLAPHLFEGRTIRSVAVQETPYKVLWVALDNHALLSFTFDFDLQVGAWHQHTTNDDQVHHLAVLPDAVEDTLYATVRRAKAGGGAFFTIEKMAPLLERERTHAVRLDRAMVYDGAPADEIIGLWPLEGETVRVVGDGADLGEFEVIDGRIQLPHDVSRAMVGIGYQGYLRTLPMAISARGVGAYGIANRKNIRAVLFNLVASASVFAGPNDVDYTELPPEFDGIGQPPLLVTGVRELGLIGDWQDEGQAHVLVTDPFPVEIVSMAFDVEVAE